MRKLGLQLCLVSVVVWLLWWAAIVLMVFLHVVLVSFGQPTPLFIECVLALVPVLFFLPWKKMLDNVDD